VNPQRLAVKIFSVDPDEPVDLDPFTPLFHHFIQEKSLPGLLFDVADYAHVPQGPGIILIGHDVDYGIDQVDGRAGLLVVRKRFGRAAIEEVLRDTLQKALSAVAAIAADGRSPIAFDTDAAELLVLDRLTAPNDDESFAAAAGRVAPVFDVLYGGATIERVGAEDARRPLGLRARANQPGSDPATLLARLEAA